MFKRTLLVLLALLFALPAMAEPQTDTDALNARIAELEAMVADLEARLAVYEPAAADPDADIITFNGGSVKQAQAQAAYDELAALYDEFGMEKSEYHDIIVEDVLAGLAEDAVLMAKAQQLGIYENTPEQIAAAEADAMAEYESTVEYYLPYFQAEGMTEAEVREATVQYLADEGLTAEVLVQETVSILWRNRLMETVTEGVSATEADVRAMYDDGVTAAKEAYADRMTFEFDYVSAEIIYWQPEGYREMEFMLLPWNDEELATEDLSARTDMLRQRYSSIWDRAFAGSSLTELAEEAQLYDYGTLAVSAEPHMMSQAVCDAAMALEMNHTTYAADADGVWVLRYVADIPAGEVPYEMLQTVLTESAHESARADAYYTQVETWLAEAEIVLHPELLR